MWDLIVSVPDHCLSFYFGLIHAQEKRYCQNKTQLHYNFGSVYKLHF